jgi:GNAT superfamily N-acetyltransferase
VAVTGSGEVIGTIGHQLVNRDEGHIRGMAVLPGWQGLGVAPALLAAVQAALRGRG